MAFLLISYGTATYYNGAEVTKCRLAKIALSMPCTVNTRTLYTLSRILCNAWTANKKGRERNIGESAERAKFR